MSTTTVISILAGSIFGPVATQLLKRWKLFDELATAVNGAICLLLAIGAWWYFTGADSDVLLEWIRDGIAAAGLGTITYNVGKTMRRSGVGAIAAVMLWIPLSQAACTPNAQAQPAEPQGGHLPEIAYDLGYRWCGSLDLGGTCGRRVCPQIHGRVNLSEWPLCRAATGRDGLTTGAETAAPARWLAALLVRHAAELRLTPSQVDYYRARIGTVASARDLAALERVTRSSSASNAVTDSLWSRVKQLRIEGGELSPIPELTVYTDFPGRFNTSCLLRRCIAFGGCVDFPQRCGGVADAAGAWCVRVWRGRLGPSGHAIEMNTCREECVPENSGLEVADCGEGGVESPGEEPGGGIEPGTGPGEACAALADALAALEDNLSTICEID